MRAWSLILCMSLTAFLPPAPQEVPTEYETRTIRGWTVQVHPDLVSAPDELATRVLELLDHKLFDVSHVVPQSALVELQKIVIWMEMDEPRVLGGVYHPSRVWLEDNDHDPRMAGCVQFGSAESFITWSFDQPWMVLHELAHAYHHQVIGYHDQRILNAFAAAVDSGEYEAILRSSGKRERAYGMTNVQEYFAELTEAYFGVNDFYPFVRAELRDFDRLGYAALESIWGMEPPAGSIEIEVDVVDDAGSDE